MLGPGPARTNQLVYICVFATKTQGKTYVYQLDGPGWPWPHVYVYGS